MNGYKKTWARLGTVLSLVVFLGGCAATQVAISKRELDVQARTSTAIFVDPVPKDRRTVYLDIRSGVMEFDRRKFKQFVKEQFAQNDNGYQLVDDPDAAQYQMIAYVLNLEKASTSAAEAALGQGYVGGAVAGAAVGGLVGQASANNPFPGMIVGGLVGGAATTIADSFVKDVTYMLVSDIQITEKAAKGVLVRKDTKIDAKVSDAGTSQQTVSEARNKKEYRTRIVTTANKANLKLEEAQDLMFQKTAYAMSGFF